MADIYWNEVRRLSSEFGKAHAALDDFLASTPRPRSDDELAKFDQLRDAADDAHSNWTKYCAENKSQR